MPTIEEAYQIALSHHQAGQFQLAEEIYWQILQAAPDHPEVLHSLGLLAEEVGRHDLAVEYIGRAAKISDQRADFHNNLGEAYRSLGRMPEAMACYRRALELDSQCATIHNNLGIACASLGNLEEAVECLGRALELAPEYAEAHSNLANALARQGKSDRAVASYRKALELRPDYASAHNNLGLLWADLGNLDEAVACFQRTIELRPDFADPWSNLGAVWQSQGRVEEAVACCQRAVQLRPDFPEAHHNLGNALGHRGEWDAAIACHRRALDLKPDFAAAHSSLLCMLQYRPEVTLSQLREAHADFERRHGAPRRAAWPPHDNSRDPDRPLRLGFVSPDFGRHPVGYFLVRVLENLDRSAGEVICYSDRVKADDMTARFQAVSTGWRDAFRMTDDVLAQSIRDDRIDILFDLTGHTAPNRLLLFARKPAPLQATWMGYVGTTGLAAMDYLLADQYEVPPESEPYYAERILRLPHAYVCYDPPTYAPPVGPLPALTSAQITFASFNRPAKITSEVVACWGGILGRVPNSRLVLKYGGMDDRATQHRIRSWFAQQRIDPQRIEMLGASPHAELLTFYHQVDVALDTFPYNGGLTTCEALWMGVPVVTCPGETFASRHSLSHLSNIGLTETIAGNLDQYVDLAVGLAEDLPRLAAIRAGLRQRMAHSPLCDGKQFAEDFLETLRRAWRQRVGAW